MVEVGGFFIGKFEDFFHFSSQGRIAIDLDFRAKADEPLDFCADSLIVEVEIAQDIDGDPLAELEQAQEGRALSLSSCGSAAGLLF